MAVYRTTARQRRARQQQVLAQRRQLAWQVAHQAAVVLKEQFGARQVWVFGSLLHETLFHLRSDIDLAAYGLDENYYRAVAHLLTLSPEIEIDLVRMEDASTTLRAWVEQEGVMI
mgnify:CR=1 FL=1